MLKDNIINYFTSEALNSMLKSSGPITQNDITLTLNKSKIEKSFHTFKDYNESEFLKQEFPDMFRDIILRQSSDNQNQQNSQNHIQELLTLIIFKSHEEYLLEIKLKSKDTKILRFIKAHLVLFLKDTSDISCEFVYSDDGCNIKSKFSIIKPILFKETKLENEQLTEELFIQWDNKKWIMQNDI